MIARSFRPAAELLEARDGPVIFLTVLALQTPFEVKPIEHVLPTAPQHSADKVVVTRAAEVYLTLSPCLHCDGN